MRPHALAAVAFDEEFQQSHPFAPCRIGKSHTTVLDPHAADVPQCNPPVSLFAGYAATVEFVGERPPGSGRQSFRRRRRHVGQRIAPCLVETQHDTLLLRSLPQRLLCRNLPAASDESHRHDPPENPITHNSSVFAKMNFSNHNSNFFTLFFKTNILPATHTCAAVGRPAAKQAPELRNCGNRPTARRPPLHGGLQYWNTMKTSFRRNRMKQGKKAFIELFRRTRCLKYSVIWHPITEIRNHPFSHRNISVRNRKEDASELLRTEQRFIAGGTGCVFPARPKDPKTATT